MVEHPFGWLSVLPPVAAIVLAIATRRVLVSLLAGIFVGALVLCHGNPVAALGQTLDDHLWATLLDPDKFSVFVFTMLMGVMVGVVNRAAGMRGLVDVVTPLANNRRRGQLATWFLGLFVFFDDYANTMLLGNTLRPLTDRLKIAREKLAYLVDSTAAPVSGLALISTWVAGEIGYVSDGLANLTVEKDWEPFDLFVASIPYRFYVLWALLFVPMIALLGRDFGPMLTAEQRALRGGGGDDGTPMKVVHDPTAPEPETPARWFNAVIPVVVTVAATIWFLYSSGRASLLAEGETKITLMQTFGNADSYGSLLWGALSGAATAFLLIVPQRIVPLDQPTLAGGRGALKMLPALAILWFASALSNMTGNDPNGDDDGAISTSAQIGIALRVQGEEMGQPVSFAQVVSRMRDQGISAEQSAVALLTILGNEAPVGGELNRAQFKQTLIDGGYEEAEVTAVMLKVSTTPMATEDSEQAAADSTTHDVPYAYQPYRLYTGVFLSNLLGDSISASWMPTLVFILAAFVAFSTGTSWGTMGIVMPLVIPLAFGLLDPGDGSVSPHDPILLGTIGAVLAGAIFGDHCSPISDTTVLSSQASSCDHIAHVRTQLPYALVVAGISIAAGTLPIGFGFPVWLTMPIGIGLMLAVIWFFGKRVEPN